MIYALTTYESCEDSYYPDYQYVEYFPTEDEAVCAALKALDPDDEESCVRSVCVEEISVVDGKIVRRQINIEEVA